MPVSAYIRDGEYIHVELRGDNREDIASRKEEDCKPFLFGSKK